MKYRFILQNIDGEGQNYLNCERFDSPEIAREQAVKSWYSAQGTDLKLGEFAECVSNSWWQAVDEDFISSVIVFLDGALEQ